MLTLKLKSGKSFTFNLKSFEREVSLRDAWRAMHGDEKYADKKFRITTRESERFEVYIDDIVVIEHEDAEYYRIEPNDVFSTESRRSERSRGSSALDEIYDKREETFVNMLRRRGVNPDYSDPFFLQMVDTVRRDHDARKMPMYVNLYVNTIKKGATP